MTYLYVETSQVQVPLIYGATTGIRYYEITIGYYSYVRITTTTGTERYYRYGALTATSR